MEPSLTMPAMTNVAVTASDTIVSKRWHTRLFGVKPTLDQDAGPYRRRKRVHRRLLVGTLIGGGAILLAGQSASAAPKAKFSKGVLTVFDDAGSNDIVISRNPAGTILVNGGAIKVTGGTPTVANTTLIQVFGDAGDDTIRLDEASGALPRANLYGGPGNDTLIGGSGPDQLFGQAGHDTLLGRGGADLLFGGSENDSLEGGDGGDAVFGESGDDRMVWQPGDDSDLNEGGTGVDTVEVNGGNGAEQFTATANGTRVRFDRLDPAPFTIDIGSSENLVLNANGGNDSFATAGNLAALIGITVDGGAGDDTLIGGNGADILLGGDGTDLVEGRQGNDVVLLGAGADRFRWNPGDGSDTVEGQAGTDTIEFNGSAADEVFEASANGTRLRFTRNLGNIVLDVNGVEGVEVNALGGADTIVVGDLSGTGVVELDGDLAGVLGGSTGDGGPDTVVVTGTAGADVVDVFGGGTTANVVGLPVQVNVLNSEGAHDALVVNAAGGGDRVTATALPAGVVRLTLDGGAGDDVLLGSQGADILIGGDANDLVFGDSGNDVALMGAGDDVVQWDPGDGNDVVEGQGGFDTMLFSGSNASENFDISAVGARVRFFRDVANVTIDLDDVERIDHRALGGADNMVVGDMSGTDVTSIRTDLRGASGGGDGQADSVTVHGTQGADQFGAVGDAGGVSVFGLHATVDIVGPEHAYDRLTLNAAGGDDVVDATSLQAGAVQLTLDGGLGADVLIGSPGNDLVVGGDGDDLALLGAGDDTFVWNPGDDNDTVEGQAGFDRMTFNGNNAAENMDVAAVGGRVRFFRNVANVTMDLDDVERIDVQAFGGADTIVVNDLSGTDVLELNTNLSAVGGGGDLQADNVIVHGTDGDDVAVVVGDSSGVAVFGLAAQMNITGAEAAHDRLRVNMLGGNDVVDASGLTADSIQLTADGGEGHDVLIGGDGNDVLIGGPGDDVLIGGPGNDIIDGGDGDDIEIQLIGDGDTVTSATVADEDWLAKHTRVVDGRTVVDVGSEARTLPRADLSELIPEVASI